MTSYALRPPVLYEIVKGNTFKPRLTIRNESGALVDVSSATVTISLGNYIDPKVNATIDASDAAHGVIVGLFPANAVPVGDWEMHGTVTMNGETQTVSVDRVRVLPAL
jgi:hypothetical protein